ncbi:hypothetical protein RQP46_007172 [Phenoliferia psychrophenolica]
MDDLFADFGDYEPVDTATAATERSQRIEKARLASSSYSAKLEPAGWFNTLSSSNPHNPTSIRNDLFRLHQLYAKKEYDAAVELGSTVLESGKGQKKMKGKAEEFMLAEEGEILDIVLRSALKSTANGVRENEVRLARRYTLHTSSSLAFAASLVLLRAASPSSLSTPLEALEAVLAAIKRKTYLHPYLAHTERIIALHFPALRDPDPVCAREEMDRIGLSESGREVLEVLLQKVKGGNGEEEDEEDEPRNVRNL